MNYNWIVLFYIAVLAYTLWELVKWRRDLFKLIEATPSLVWLLLTKRIGNVVKMTDQLAGNLILPPNAAIGATIAGSRSRC